MGINAAMLMSVPVHATLEHVKHTSFDVKIKII